MRAAAFEKVSREGAVDKKVRRIDQFRDCDGCLKVAFFSFFLFSVFPL